MEKIIENGLMLCYEVTEEGVFRLLYCGKEDAFRMPPDGYRRFCNPFGLRLTGETTPSIGKNRHLGISGGAWHFLSSEKNRETDGTHYVFWLGRDGMRIALHYRFYDGVGALRAWNELFNDGEEPVGVEYLSSFCLPMLALPEEAGDIRVWLPHNGWRREVDWKEYTLPELGIEKINSHSTTRIARSNTGSWSTKELLPMSVWDDTKTGNTVLWQIENNGSWQWEISEEEGPFYLLLSGPDFDGNHWYKQLKKGESFRSVPVAVAFGKGFSDAVGILTQYRRKIVMPCAGDEGLPVIFNDYMNCLWAQPTTENEFPMIHAAKELGAEIYCMDAGWYSDENNWWDTIGEWLPSEKRFPNGMEEVFSEIEKCGMIPGIWLEIENMGVRCPALGQFEDECFVMQHGKRVNNRGRYQFDFRNEKVRAYVTGVIDRLVERYRIGYVKIDYNSDVACGTECRSDSLGDGLLEMNRAYLDWIDSIHEKYPALILENCSSGGMRMDYAMLSHHAVQSVSDQEDCLKMSPIAAGAATALLPEQAAIWAYPKACNTLAETALNMVNALPLRMHLSGEALQWSPEQTALVREGVSLYKAVRKHIRKAIPFYPIGIPQYGSDWICAGYRGEETFLAVWRLGGEKELFIPLGGACSEASVLYPQGGGTVAAENGGIRVTVSTCPGAVFVKIK